MKYGLVVFAFTISIVLMIGCTREDQKRIKQLHNMPVLWETTLLLPDPDMPEMEVIIPMKDRYDPSFVEHMTDTAKKTEDYIPEEVMAFAVAEYDNKPREITIQIGDRVGVLKSGSNNTDVPVYLVRTKQNTYAWLYAYHIQDEHGERIGMLK